MIPSEVAVRSWWNLSRLLSLLRSTAIASHCSQKMAAASAGPTTEPSQSHSASARAARPARGEKLVQVQRPKPGMKHWIYSGWWLSHPSEQYEFVNWDVDIPNRWKIKVMFQTTNQYWNDYSPNDSLELLTQLISSGKGMARTGKDGTFTSYLPFQDDLPYNNCFQVNCQGGNSEALVSSKSYPGNQTWQWKIPYE